MKHIKRDFRSKTWVRCFSDILLKNINVINFITVCFEANHTCYCVNRVSVTSLSRYNPHYQRKSSMYIRGLIPCDFAELAEAVPIVE